LIQLTDDEGTGSVVTSRVTQALDDASAEVDSHVGKIVDVPMTTVPQLIEVITLDITSYRLHLRRDRVPEHIEQAAKDARTLLYKIGKGDATIPGLTQSPAKADDGVFQVDAGDRLFTRGNLAGL
jgi:phage gp36-like protein